MTCRICTEGILSSSITGSTDMHGNPRKTTSVRQLGHIDLGPVRDDILAIPEQVWEQENASKPNRFETLGKTSHIVFRFVQTMQDWRQSYDRPLWAEWRSRLEPILQQATAAYGYARGSFPRIMLARMAPGGRIHPHTDNAPAASWPHKIHVPIQTNDQVQFFIGPQVHRFSEGQAVELNNLGTHSVSNDGDSERIHLIFEYYDLDQPSWLDASR